jgi:hypothetical protein
MCRLMLVAPFVLLLSCNPFQETERSRTVNTGETAVVAHNLEAAAYVATDKSHVYALAKSVEAGNLRAVEDLVGRGHALKLLPNTRVRVMREFSNERLVRIDGGDSTGKWGWVPSAWLRPAPVQAGQGSGRVAR